MSVERRDTPRKLARESTAALRALMPQARAGWVELSAPEFAAWEACECPPFPRAAALSFLSLLREAARPAHSRDARKNSILVAGVYSLFKKPLRKPRGSFSREKSAEAKAFIIQWLFSSGSIQAAAHLPLHWGCSGPCGHMIESVIKEIDLVLIFTKVDGVGWGAAEQHLVRTLPFSNCPLEGESYCHPSIFALACLKAKFHKLP